jgi:hypothetical protein
LSVIGACNGRQRNFFDPQVKLPTYVKSVTDARLDYDASLKPKKETAVMRI